MILSMRSVAMLGIAVGVTFSAGSALAWGRGHDGPHHPPQPPQPPSRQVPEISGSQMGTGLTLVLGGVAVVLGRRRRKLV